MSVGGCGNRTQGLKVSRQPCEPLRHHHGSMSKYLSPLALVILPLGGFLTIPHIIQPLQATPGANLSKTQS